MSADAKKTLAILALIVILLLVSINVTGEKRHRIAFVEEVVLVVFAPLQDFFMRSGFAVRSFFHTVVNYRVILAENISLKEELALQSEHANQILELQKENDRLRLLLGFKSRIALDFFPAEVIARDPSVWFEAVTINKGYRDGVEMDMPVVTGSGLIGKVIEVSYISSQVALLTDQRVAVSALVQRSRDPGVVGIVEGYPEEAGYLKMTKIPPGGDIVIGDIIISSGLGGIYPKGLLIGHVRHTGEDEYGLLQYAVLKPFANFNRIEEVLLVRSEEVETLPEEYFLDGPIANNENGGSSQNEGNAGR